VHSAGKCLKFKRKHSVSAKETFGAKNLEFKEKFPKIAAH